MYTKAYIGLASVLVLILAVVYLLHPLEQPAAIGAAAYSDDKQEMIDRGEYLVTIQGCQDCHTPKIMTPQGPQPDPERAFMGYPADEPVPEVPEGVIRPGGWSAMMNDDLTAAVGPCGISFATNLTPDDETGIGTWTLDMFKGSLRTGQHMGEGRPILPPMPWYNYVEMTDEDIEAVYTYLQSIEPIRNPVPEPVPAEDLGFPPFPPEE